MKCIGMKFRAFFMIPVFDIEAVLITAIFGKQKLIGLSICISVRIYVITLHLDSFLMFWLFEQSLVEQSNECVIEWKWNKIHTLSLTLTQITLELRRA